jgi:ABC-2 type transport system permease protein
MVAKRQTGMSAPRSKEEAVDAPPPISKFKINRWLPYWAVFQADVRQTLNSWVYRAWVIVSVLSITGFLLYRVGVYREAGIVQHASTLISDLLRWCMFGSVTLIIVLTAGSISAERGTMADSVLSRGISRYQYFLGKWHARLATVLGTFLIVGLAAMLCSFFLLHEDLSFGGSLVALLTVAAFLGIVISGGVSASAVFNSTVLGIAVLWITLYGAGFALSLLPAHYPSPYRAINSLPVILKGEYSLYALGRLMGWSALLSCVLAVLGLGYFSRRDV